MATAKKPNPFAGKQATPFGKKTGKPAMKGGMPPSKMPMKKGNSRGR